MWKSLCYNERKGIWGKLPQCVLEHSKSWLEGYFHFALELLERLKGTVPGVRFSFSGFAMEGPEGLLALSRLTERAKRLGYCVLLTVPEAMSSREAEHFAETFFAPQCPWSFDILVTSAYLGTDSVRPYVEKLKDSNRDLLVVVRTGNKSAPELQDLLTGGRLVHMAAADKINRLAQELGINRAAYAAVGCHDTASAVAAVPGTGSFAFCSSGTWSLFGVETDKPILTDAVRDANFSNEGTVQGGFRPLKNNMGLWLIQECRRDWIKAGRKYSWDEIVVEAQKAQPMRSIIDTDYGPFFAAGQMEEKIRAYCASTGQPQPETVGEVARCIYESLALQYRWSLERLEEIKGARIDSLNLVGGGIQNKLLNQMVADAIDRPVVTGPIEGAAIGNLLMQAMALGELKSLEEVRQVVRNSE